MTVAPHSIASQSDDSGTSQHSITVGCQWHLTAYRRPGETARHGSLYTRADYVLWKDLTVKLETPPEQLALARRLWEIISRENEWI